MGSRVACPKCGRVVSTRPLNAWKFGRYDVKRYQCDACKAKFNLYTNHDRTFTIPKGK